MDINSDGLLDLVVGETSAQNFDNMGYGHLFVFIRGESGELQLREKLTNPNPAFKGKDISAHLGDYDEDGRVDMYSVLGYGGFKVRLHTNSGSAQAYNWSNTSQVSLPGTSGYENVTLTLGDLDNDGIDDFLYAHMVTRLESSVTYTPYVRFYSGAEKSSPTSWGSAALFDTVMSFYNLGKAMHMEVADINSDGSNDFLWASKKNRLYVCYGLSNVAIEESKVQNQQRVPTVSYLRGVLQLPKELMAKETTVAIYTLLGRELYKSRAIGKDGKMVLPQLLSRGVYLFRIKGTRTLEGRFVIE